MYSSPGGWHEALATPAARIAPSQTGLEQSREDNRPVPAQAPLGHPQNHTCTVRLAFHFQVHCRQTELVVLLQSCRLLGALHGAPHTETAPHGRHLLVELLPGDFVVKSQPAEFYFHPVGLQRARELQHRVRNQRQQHAEESGRLFVDLRHWFPSKKPTNGFNPELPEIPSRANLAQINIKILRTRNR